VLIRNLGGAFIMPGTYAHFEFMFHARNRAKKGLHDFAIFALEYTLMPQAVYPTQLRQAVLALRYLLEVQHRSPSTASSLLLL
jgi:acetyl esterase/lipase